MKRLCPCLFSVQVKSQTGIESRYREKQSRASHTTTQRLDYVVLSDLETEIEVLQQKIDIEKVSHGRASRPLCLPCWSDALLWRQAVHHATEDFLSKRSVQLAQDTKSWEAKHSLDTNNKEKELDRLKVKHQRDLIKLKAGRPNVPCKADPNCRAGHPPDFETVDSQEIEDAYNVEIALKEERELKAQQMIAAEEAKLGQDLRRKQAASKIQVGTCPQQPARGQLLPPRTSSHTQPLALQAMWRGYKVRMAAKGGGKKGKGKGKKGKKK